MSSMWSIYSIVTKLKKKPLLLLKLGDKFLLEGGISDIGHFHMTKGFIQVVTC